MYGVDVLVENHSPQEWKLRSYDSIRVSFTKALPVEAMSKKDRLFCSPQMVRPKLKSELSYWLGFSVDDMTVTCLSSLTETTCYFFWDYTRHVVHFPVAVNSVEGCFEQLWIALLGNSDYESVKLYNRLANAFICRLVERCKVEEIKVVGIYRDTPFEASVTWTRKGRPEQVVVCTTLGDEKPHLVSLETHPVARLHRELLKSSKSV